MQLSFRPSSPVVRHNRGDLMSNVVVFVHGAGKQMSNYYKEPLAAITKILGAEPPAVPVYYADITNIGSPVGIAATPAKKSSRGKKSTTRRRKPRASSTTVPDSPQVTQFKMAFAMQVQADLNALPPSERTTALFSIPGQMIAELLATDLSEIARYLFNSDTFNKIQKRMREGLDQAAKQGDSIVIASHSLGTVVAFDALHAVASEYKIDRFYTLGSPLAKLRRLGLRAPDLGTIPQCVNEWLNLYDTTDAVANALGPAFPLPGYRLRDIFVDVAQAPIPSHDYFGNPETLKEIASALQ